MDPLDFSTMNTPTPVEQLLSDGVFRTRFIVRWRPQLRPRITGCLSRPCVVHSFRPESAAVPCDSLWHQISANISKTSAWPHRTARTERFTVRAVTFSWCADAGQ